MRGRAGGLHASRGENDVCLGSNKACVCVCVCLCACVLSITLVGEGENFSVDSSSQLVNTRMCVPHSHAEDTHKTSKKTTKSRKEK